MIEKYEKEFEITCYECDENCVLRLRSLFNLFQNMADTHASLLGVGYAYCVAHQLGWVGSAYHLQINRLPHWGDKIILRTWPSKATPVTAIREFEMIDKSTGEVLVRAGSQWVLIDTVKMRPVIVLPHIQHFEPLPERSVDTAFSKLPPLERVDITAMEVVRADDIDINHHVNNAVYPAWILDALPADWNAAELTEIQIQYRQPVKAKTSIHIQTQVESDICLHAITSIDGATEYARVRTVRKMK